MTIRQQLITILLVLSFTTCQAQVNFEEQFNGLFEEVQLKAVFPDSKTFPDCTPLLPAATILANYEKQRRQKKFDLKAFVLQHFTLPQIPVSGYVTKPDISAQQHITELWPVLTRQPMKNPPMSSLIALPKPYLVPGGRFGEIYYWDSYFTMLGLQASGQTAMIKNMVDNFSYLINRYGFIPNGNRTYYLGRSQPPFYAQMVNMLTEIQGRRTLISYLPYLQKEYNFWMDGKDRLTQNGQADRRVVRLADNVFLNRYYDDRDTPRPEAYKEDVAIARQKGGLFKKARPASEVYRHLRASAESGWDFSSRWFKDGKNLRTIQTTNIIPIDLNCLLFHLEITLSDGFQLKGDKVQSENYLQAARRRFKAIQRYCWNARRGFFCDYNFLERKSTDILSLAGVYPLLYRTATRAQSQQMAKVLQRDFLKTGGLLTTLTNTGQQWDAPNGWAPLQWIAIQGLRQYGHQQLADQVKLNWTAENLRLYKATGKMVEKYNVVNPTVASGGEYPNQDGFGWTNGVLLKLLKEK